MVVSFMTLSAPFEKSKFLYSGGSMVARLKPKGVDGRAPSGVEPAAYFDASQESSPRRDIVRIDRLMLFLNSAGGAAWPFSVGRVICLIDSSDQRDVGMLKSVKYDSFLIVS